MPQMSPMTWTLICLLSLTTSSIMLTSITKKTKSNKNMKISSKNISWKW